MTIALIYLHIFALQGTYQAPVCIEAASRAIPASLHREAALREPNYLGSKVCPIHVTIVSMHQHGAIKQRIRSVLSLFM